MKKCQDKKSETLQDQEKKFFGRPTKRTQEIIDLIISGLSQGTPLTVICRECGISDTIVRNWMKDDEQLSCDIARARDIGFDVIALDALRIADTPVIGIEESTKEWGTEVKRSDMLGHRKLQVETRLKLLAKWDPKRYGDLMRQEISGPDGSPITQANVSLSPEQESNLAALVELAKTKAKK